MLSADTNALSPSSSCHRSSRVRVEGERRDAPSSLALRWLLPNSRKISHATTSARWRHSPANTSTTTVALGRLRVDICSSPGANNAMRPRSPPSPHLLQAAITCAVRHAAPPQGPASYIPSHTERARLRPRNVLPPAPPTRA